MFLWATTPVLISLLTFLTFSLLGNPLTAARVFTAVALFSMLTGPLNAFPWVINGLVEAAVSLRRIEAFLVLPEFQPSEFYSCRAEEPGLGLQDAAFSPSPGAQPLVAGLSLQVEPGELMGVTGPVGAGKSSLLAGWLGELELGEGRASLAWAGPVGLVTQQPWLQAATVRDNILFGRPYQVYSVICSVLPCECPALLVRPGDGGLRAAAGPGSSAPGRPHSRYRSCTSPSSVLHITAVGEGGAALSGGQRARVALARAVYQDCNTYLIG